MTPDLGSMANLTAGEWTYFGERLKEKLDTIRANTSIVAFSVQSGPSSDRSRPVGRPLSHVHVRKLTRNVATPLPNLFFPGSTLIGVGGP